MGMASLHVHLRYQQRNALRRKQQPDNVKKENERRKLLAQEIKRARRAEQSKAKEACQKCSLKSGRNGLTEDSSALLVQHRSQPSTPGTAMGTALHVLAPEFHLDSMVSSPLTSPSVSKGASFTPSTSFSVGDASLLLWMVGQATGTLHRRRFRHRWKCL